MTRRRWFCGVCASAASGALAGIALPAAADAHDAERSIGKQVYDDLQKKDQIVYDSTYYPVVRRVGARIGEAAQPHWWPANVIIVKGKQANAFSVPGGNVYVNEALLQQAENETELANVVGHEFGHIVLGHVMDRLHKAQTANIIGGILGLFIRSQDVATLLGLAGNYAFLNFSRAQEYQADHEGVILSNRAGFNPYGMPWFFTKLEKLYGNAGFEQYVQDHPSAKDRINRIVSFIRSDPAQFGQWSYGAPPLGGLPQARAGESTRLVINQ